MGKSIRLGQLGAWVVLWSALSVPVFAQSAPAALKGKIITSSKEIELSATDAGLVAKLQKQDVSKFTPDEEGRYTVYFVAFFNQPLPEESIGVVVLDGKKEAVAVADVKGTKGQTTLSSQMLVDSTETPNKPHVLQVFFLKNKKTVVLAKKEIFLKK